MDRCEHCGHDWHGQPCTHVAVTRGPTGLTQHRCQCAGPWPS